MKIYISKFTVSGIQNLLAKKEISAFELVNEYINYIQNQDRDIHAFLEVTPELARAQAARIDHLLSRDKTIEEIGLLAGVPFAVKDNILIDGIRCTAGSKILENYIGAYEATVIKKLRKAGAIFIGKTNLDEFAMGSSTENSAFGPTKNPHDHTRVPGGSSGGSAAAVASGMAVAALGSDTGGSIRQPASFCGVVGLKPTYGAVSRYGMIAMASSLDQIGPLAKTVDDAKIVFDVIKGKDYFDATSANNNSKFKIQNSKLRIGIPKEYFIKGLDPKVEKVINEAVEKLRFQGSIEIHSVSLPHAEYALACYYVIMPAEVSANLARFDGIRYGERESQNNLLAIYLQTRGKKFGKETRRRIMLGTYLLSAGYYDAYYKQAQKVRALIRKDFEKVFESVDLIITPTSPTLPFKIGEKTTDPLAMYLADIYTVSVNLAGVPALSLNAGWSGNLPVGLQIIGPDFSEENIFTLAKEIEKITLKSREYELI